MLLSFNFAQSFQDDKITVFKGKDNETYDGGDFCKGSGSKCVEMTASELAGVIKFLKDIKE